MRAMAADGLGFMAPPARCVVQGGDGDLSNCPRLLMAAQDPAWLAVIDLVMPLMAPLYEAIPPSHQGPEEWNCAILALRSRTTAAELAACAEQWKLQPTQGLRLCLVDGSITPVVAEFSRQYQLIPIELVQPHAGMEGFLAALLLPLLAPQRLICRDWTDVRGAFSPTARGHWQARSSVVPAAQDGPASIAAVLPPGAITHCWMCRIAPAHYTMELLSTQAEAIRERLTEEAVSSDALWCLNSPDLYVGYEQDESTASEFRLSVEAWSRAHPAEQARLAELTLALPQYWNGTYGFALYDAHQTLS